MDIDDVQALGSNFRLGAMRSSWMMASRASGHMTARRIVLRSTVPLQLHTTYIYRL